MNFLDKINYIFIRKKNYFWQKIFAFLSPTRRALPTEKEQKAIDLLRQKVAAIENTSASNQSKIWSNYQQKVLHQIENDDPRGFTKWQPIAETMFFEPPDEELHALRKLPAAYDWLLRTAALEHRLGNPKPHKLYPKSSGNLLHHAYSLTKLLCHTLPNLLQKINTIWEWGGGYGSFCRLCFQGDFGGNYTIFDLPLFAALQQYYLAEVCPEATAKNKILWQKIADTNTDSPDVFVALWSLSETPLAVRAELLVHLTGCKYWLIAYQYQFDEIDNSMYFNNLQLKFSHIHWFCTPITHLPNNAYLIGVPKKNT